ncbi:S49 family peptidase, partial [bacterium]|nr:S49 family peptidase [bacterium]
MRKIYFVIFASIIVAGLCFAQGGAWGTAAIDDVMGMHKNPGYLGLGHGFESAFFGSFSSDSNSNLNIKNTHGFLLNMNGLAGGYENIVGSKRWTLGGGVGDRSFGIGYLRTWSANDAWGEGWRNGWVFGTMVRPWSFVSAGWAYESTPTMEGHRFGLALRPATWRVTLFGDIIKPNEIEWKDMDWGVGGELHLVDGIRLFGRYDYYGDGTDEGISAGVRIDNPFGGVGGIAAGTTDEMSDFTVYSMASSQKFPSIFPTPKYALRIDLAGDYSERPRGGLFGGRKKTFIRLIKTLDEAARDKEVEALVIRYRFPSLDFGQTEELRTVLDKFKKAGKPILLYADNLGNLSYYLASVADYIAIPPSGSGVDIIGLRAEMRFFKGTLEKVGVKPDFVSIGEYKSAMEMFMLNKPSEHAAQNMNEILDGYEAEFVSGIAQGRGLSDDAVRGLIDNGPYTDLEAESLGLVDSLMYLDEFEKYVEEERHLKTRPFAIYAMHEKRDMDWGQPDRIAVIVIDGNIVKGKGGSGGLFGGSSIGEREIVAAVRAAKNNRSVKGILLRVSSGGGSALA